MIITVKPLSERAYETVARYGPEFRVQGLSRLGMWLVSGIANGQQWNGWFNSRDIQIIGNYDD